MPDIVQSIITDHDWNVVALAAIICLAASLGASVILNRVKERAGFTRFIWVLAISVVVGFGIWATHFIAMLAYKPGSEFTYAPNQTLLSLLVIIAISIPAFTLIASTGSRFASRFGGVMFGLAIAAMHYTGMEGLMPEGTMIWDKNFVIASVLAAVILSTIAVEMHHMSGRVAGQIGTAVFLAFAICATHFLGMSALTISPLGGLRTMETGLSPDVLGTIIAATSIIVLQAGVAAAIFDSWFHDKKQADEWQLTKHETLLSSMGEVAKIGAWELDIETRTPHWSPQMCALHKVEEGFQPDMNIAASYFPGPARNEFLRAIDQACRGNGCDVELQFQADKRDFRWVRVVCKTMIQQGYPSKLIGAYQDITTQKNARNALENALREADQANKLKSEFLANMSHEIRTPMNGVLGMTQLLKTTDLNEKQKSFADVILSSGTALLGLINDILDTSKIEAGLLEIHPDPFDLTELITSAADAVSGIAMQKGLSVTHYIDPNLAPCYMGDAPRLRQVLINLMGNGLKFTETGMVQAAVHLEETGFMRFDVTDTGPGIPPEQQGHIFGRFTQADGSTTRKHGGTGLGLAISHDLIKLMGGDIGLHSQPGRGSTFWFRVPLQPADMPARKVA